MDPITAKLMSAAGAALGDPVFIDEVFSTFVYDGTGAAQTINNGIDLSGEGGFVWTKHRGGTDPNSIFDTERGNTKVIYTNSDSAESTDSNEITSFNSNGYTLNQDGGSTNGNGNSYCSWTFRKCPGFLDIVTYTGTGSSGKTVSHSLGSSPGFIMVKRLDADKDWTCYHRSIGTAGYIEFNKIDAYNPDTNGFTGASSSNFTLGSDASVNASGGSYIAYVFAHDDQSFGEDRDQAVIKCDSFSGNGSTNTINLGFEPQWLLLKPQTRTGAWALVDMMRGFVTRGRNDARFFMNDTAQESSSDIAEPTPNGFKVTASAIYNESNEDTIYIAIRRPMKTTDDEDEVLDIKKVTGNGAGDRHIEGSSGASVTDMHLVRRVNTNGEAALIGTRLQGPYSFVTNETDNEAENKYGGVSANNWDVMNGVKVSSDAIMNGSGHTFMHYFFSRKPEIFDITTYTGTGSSGLVVPHNLGVTPEFLIYKNRSSNSTNFFALKSDSKYANLNNSNTFSSTALSISLGSSSYTINTTGTSTNASGEEYIAYLFASKAGISKIGTYSGTGSEVDVDCGFRARFVIIKRIDVSGNWWIVDSVHGINAGNDPGWNFNNNNSGTAQYDLIDTDGDGFTVAADRFDVNQSGGTYFFMAFK